MWRCAIPNIQPYMSRLILEFVPSTKIYRVVQYKTLIVRFFVSGFTFRQKVKGVSNSLRDTWTIKAHEKRCFRRAFDVL